jgi:hypothetical protein
MDPPLLLIDRWPIVQSALESWSRTIRLCLILLVIGVPIDTATWMVLRILLR